MIALTLTIALVCGLLISMVSSVLVGMALATVEVDVFDDQGQARLPALVADLTARGLGIVVALVIALNGAA